MSIREVDKMKSKGEWLPVQLPQEAEELGNAGGKRYNTLYYTGAFNHYVLFQSIKINCLNHSLFLFQI